MVTRVDGLGVQKVRGGGALTWNANFQKRRNLKDEGKKLEGPSFWEEVPS